MPLIEPTEPFYRFSGPLCECGYPEECHGDRAICACGGYAWWVDPKLNVERAVRCTCKYFKEKECLESSTSSEATEEQSTESSSTSESSLSSTLPWVFSPVMAQRALPSGQ